MKSRGWESLEDEEQDNHKKMKEGEGVRWVGSISGTLYLIGGHQGSPMNMQVNWDVCFNKIKMFNKLGLLQLQCNYKIASASSEYFLPPVI